MTDEQIEAALRARKHDRQSQWFPNGEIGEVYISASASSFFRAATDPDTGYEAALRDLRAARAEMVQMQSDHDIATNESAKIEAQYVADLRDARAQLREAVGRIRSLTQRLVHRGIYAADSEQWLAALSHRNEEKGTCAICDLQIEAMERAGRAVSDRRRRKTEREEKP